MTYPVREDTLLLKSVLRELELKDLSVLEIGTGSGEIAVEAAKRGAKVTATDINLSALNKAKEKATENSVNIEFVQSDLFEEIEGVFDIILFNPPYLPGQRKDKDSLVGGEDGTEVIEEFLSEADQYLKETGTAYFITSDLSDRENLHEYGVKTVRSEKLWFEKLHLEKYPS